MTVHLHPRAADGRDPRRRELEVLFSEAGLLPPARRFRSVGVERGGLVERLAAALVRAGPLFVAFGRHLACRPDLLPPGDCLDLDRALDAVDDPVTGRSGEEPLDGLARALGADPWSVFRTLEPEPFAERWPVRSYRAVTIEGDPVVVLLRWPGVEERMASDLPLLSLLAPAVATLDPLGSPDDVFEGFRRVVAGVVDLRLRASALETLAAGAPEALAVPRVDRRLSTERVLVREDLAGRPPAPDRPGTPGRIALLWLHQAFVGRDTAAALRPEDVEVLPDGGIAFVGGVLLHPPASVQEHLWDHLVAAASRDPATAGEHLLRELDPRPGASDESELRQRLRQAVPFRDGAWTPDGESLAESLFTLWRLAREEGYRLRAPALDLARGIAALALFGRRIAPEEDALREGVEELRLVRGLGRLREAVTPDDLGKELLPYAHLALELPQKLDAVLTLLARGEARLRLEEEASTTPPRTGRAGLLAFAGLAAVLAVGLVLGRLSDPASGTGSGEAFSGTWGGLALLTAGGLLLWALTRGDR